jgi:hypothetical protein
MIEKFAVARGPRLSEFLDLNHTGNSMILVSLLIPKFARGCGIERWRTSELGHWPLTTAKLNHRLKSPVTSRHIKIYTKFALTA